MKYRLPLLAVALLATSYFPAASAHAGQPAAEDLNQPQVVELVLSPAAEPRPALRFSLLPKASERTPGNAAQRYHRAILLQKTFATDTYEKHQAWVSAPLDDPGIKREMGKWLSTQNYVLAEVRAGAFREYCDWDFRMQDLRGLAVLNFSLEEIQNCRSLARTLQLQARYELMDGRPTDAIQTLGIGFQLARDTAQPPHLVCALVGQAILHMMTDELLLLIQHSNANYYWALAALPKPLVELEPAMQFEMNMPLQMFPFLADAETANRSPDEWRRLIVECLQGLASVSGDSRTMTGWQADVAAAGLVAKLYPIAKEQLIADGMSEARIETMPVGQVVAIQTARSMNYAFHEVFKLSHLPYEEATARMPATLKRLEDEGHLHGKFSGREGLPLTSLLLPAVANVIHVEVRSARNLAALQAIEALRMHAAGTGKLPQSLAEVTVVPVPKNPATGLPFQYTLDVDSGSATLDLPPVGGLAPKHDGKRYVIKLKGNQ